MTEAQWLTPPDPELLAGAIVESEDEDSGGQRHADKVNAPLSPETIAALRAQLESGEYARYRSPRHGEQEK